LIWGGREAKVVRCSKEMVVEGEEGANVANSLRSALVNHELTSEGESQNGVLRSVKAGTVQL
jgi:hypothetical protein